jgi:hypothetical protein
MEIPTCELSFRTVYLPMPTVLRIGAFRFHFYSDEGNEPPHIHVAYGDGEAKLWLYPVLLASSTRISPSAVRDIERLVFKNQDLLLEAYRDFHS